MESAAAVFRRSIEGAGAGKSESYERLPDGLPEGSMEPESRVCRRECFNLPAGTRIFRVSVPVFQLQIAELGGELKIVSALPHFQ